MGYKRNQLRHFEHHSFTDTTWAYQFAAGTCLSNCNPQNNKKKFSLFAKFTLPEKSCDQIVKMHSKFIFMSCLLCALIVQWGESTFLETGTIALTGGTLLAGCLLLKAAGLGIYALVSVRP